MALTIVIGLPAGLSAVRFTLAIDRINLLLFGLSPSAVRLVLVPTLVSLIVGFLLARYFQEARGSGVQGAHPRPSANIQEGKQRAAYPC